MVLIGGLQGDDSNPFVYVYDIMSSSWSLIKQFTVNITRLTVTIGRCAFTTR
jgi:hypothetical protein